MNFEIFQKLFWDNFGVIFSLIFLIISFTSHKYVMLNEATLELLFAWPSKCLHEKEDGEVSKDELFNSFCN